MGTFSDYGKESVINEAYFGKSKDLKDAERILGIFRKKYFKHKYVNSCNSDPLLYQFEDIIADFFGFSSFFLDIKPDAVANAATYPCGWLISGKTAKIKKTKDGFKYDGTPSLYILIYSYLLFNPNYTDGEIMSIILHEIGHNFSERKSRIVYAQNVVRFVQCLWCLMWDIISLDIKNLILHDMPITDLGREALKDIRNYINKNKFMSVAYSGLKFVASLPLSILYNFILIINPFVSVGRIFDNLAHTLMKNHVFIISGFCDERIADNFATIYGYGPDAMSAELKLGKYASPSVQAIESVPLLGWIYDIFEIPTTYILSLGDEHPESVSRAKAQYNYLLNEIDKCNKPRLKKELEEEIKECEKILDQLDKDSKKLLSGTLIRDNYNKVAMKLKKGDDPREYLANYERDSRAWDKLYDEAEEE